MVRASRPGTLLFLLLLLSNCQPPAQDSSDWTLIWSDEFEGLLLNRENWTPVIMPDPFNEELQFYTDRADEDAGANIRIEEGALVIEGRAEQYQHRQFTSGRLSSQGKREFLYGRFEARMKLPAEVGMWPAFWLLGGNIAQVGWPRCGEIDIMEGKGRLPNWTSGALHRGSDTENHWFTAQEFRLPQGNFHDDWHVFALEWEPQEIRWYVDEVQFHQERKEPGTAPADWPFDEGHRFFIILNLAIGGWFDKPHLPPSEFQPQRLFVDYVRVYQKSRR